MSYVVRAGALCGANFAPCIPLIAAALLLASCSSSSDKRSMSSATSGRYSHTLHNRFYEAWVQPKLVGAPRGKISVPVDVRIGPQGRVLSFAPMKSSGYARIDRSVAAVGRRVRKVAPPPITSGEYKLRIYFDLDVER